MALRARLLVPVRVVLRDGVLGTGLGLEVGGVAASTVRAVLTAVACPFRHGLVVAGMAYVHPFGDGSVERLV
jgi:hypothetical protein